jgi:hypothetical protein
MGVSHGICHVILYDGYNVHRIQLICDNKGLQGCTVVLTKRYSTFSQHMITKSFGTK